MNLRTMLVSVATLCSLCLVAFIAASSAGGFDIAAGWAHDIALSQCSKGPGAGSASDWQMCLSDDRNRRQVLQ